jgi:nucleoside-diphosphate-sugar epimerase
LAKLANPFPSDAVSFTPFIFGSVSLRQKRVAFATPITMTTNRVVYLTGASGFLGGFLARDFEKDDSIVKVYCPIRAKKGQSGPDRLSELLPSLKKCVYMDPNDVVPADVTHVILNAYNTRFDEEHRSKLKGNIEPILKLLDQCKQRSTTDGNTIRGITFVSTAYTQPPLPFRRYEGNYLPLLLDEENDRKKMTATEVYDKIMRMDDHFTVTDVLPDLHPYYAKNSYVFSKHLLETMLGEKYPDLPISIVRPSMVAIPLTLDYGLTTKAAVPLLMQLSQHWICMAPKTGGKVNVILMEDTCADIKLGVFEAAKAAQCNVYGRCIHETIASCSYTEHNDSREFFKAGAPHVPRIFDIPYDWLLHLVRNIEYFAAWCIFGSKAAHLLHVVYVNYDFYMDNTWDFEARHKHNLLGLIKEKRSTYLANLTKLKASKDDKPLSESYLRSRLNVLICLMVTAFAILLRRAIV